METLFQGGVKTGVKRFSEDLLHLDLSLVDIFPLLLDGALLSEFGMLPGPLPVYMAPAVLMPAPQRLIQRRHFKKLPSPDTAEPCGHDGHGKRDLVVPEKTAHRLEGATARSDVIGAEKDVGAMVCRVLLHRCRQTLLPVDGRYPPDRSILTGAQVIRSLEIFGRRARLLIQSRTLLTVAFYGMFNAGRRDDDFSLEEKSVSCQTRSSLTEA